VILHFFAVFIPGNVQSQIKKRLLKAKSGNLKEFLVRFYIIK